MSSPGAAPPSEAADARRAATDRRRVAVLERSHSAASARHAAAPLPAWVAAALRVGSSSSVSSRVPTTWWQCRHWAACHAHSARALPTTWRPRLLASLLARLHNQGSGGANAVAAAHTAKHPESCTLPTVKLVLKLLTVAGASRQLRSPFLRKSIFKQALAQRRGPTSLDRDRPQVRPRANTS